MPSVPALPVLRVASPCSAPWHRMDGDDRVRFCLQCKQSVYNLSAMTAEEGLALLREKRGDLCVRLYRRADGTVLTADCPVGLKARLKHRVSRAWFALGALIGALLTGKEMLGDRFGLLFDGDTEERTLQFGDGEVPAKPGLDARYMQGRFVQHFSQSLDSY